jgi:hypothetical protein
MPAVISPQSRCRFGMSRGDVTPPVGIYHRMWGAATHDRSTGVHRPLTATAVVLRPLDAADAGEQVVVALDHCLLWTREMEALIASVCARTGLAAEHLLVAFSHTHGAGLMGLERAALPGGDLIEPYLDGLAVQVAELVRAARLAVQPVTITYAAGRCALAAQRDFWDDATKQYVCGFNPQGAADHTVLVARVTDAVGRTAAVLVNYACHPTTLAWQNTLISPDYPGAMRELVEQATGATCVFLQGASGDLGPREGYVGDVALADRNGRQLGHAVLATLEGMPPPDTQFEYAGPVVSGATIGVWAYHPLDAATLRRQAAWQWRRLAVDLPYRPDLPTPDGTRAERASWEAQEHEALRLGDAARARQSRAMVERMTRQLTRLAALPPGPTFPLQAVLWRLGDALWVAVEGEHYQSLQRALRRRFPETPVVVMTLANGWRPAYLVDAPAYGKGIYQETVAVLAAGSLEQLTEALGQALGAL